MWNFSIRKRIFLYISKISNYFTYFTDDFWQTEELANFTHKNHYLVYGFKPKLSTNKKEQGGASSNKCNKMFRQSCREIFERQTKAWKATREVKTRQFLTTFEGQKRYSINSTPRLPTPPYLRTRTSRETQSLLSLDARRFSSKTNHLLLPKRVNLRISLSDFLLHSIKQWNWKNTVLRNVRRE